MYGSVGPAGVEREKEKSGYDSDEGTRIGRTNVDLEGYFTEDHTSSMPPNLFQEPNETPSYYPNTRRRMALVIVSITSIVLALCVANYSGRYFPYLSNSTPSVASIINSPIGDVSSSIEVGRADDVESESLTSTVAVTETSPMIEKIDSTISTDTAENVDVVAASNDAFVAIEESSVDSLEGDSPSTDTVEVVESIPMTSAADLPSAAENEVVAPSSDVLSESEPEVAPKDADVKNDVVSSNDVQSSSRGGNPKGKAITPSPSPRNTHSPALTQSVVGQPTSTTQKTMTASASTSASASTYKTATNLPTEAGDFKETESTVDASTDEMFVQASNEYGVFDAPYPWLNDIAGTQLVEPYKWTTLSLSGSFVSSKYTYYWLINNDEGLSYNGTLVFGATKQQLMFTAPGKYSLSVMAVNSDSEVYARYTSLLVCKYVKREIRSLTTSDRDKFLDAMATLWTTGQDKGQAKYGPKFTNIDIFVAAHSMASNDIMCDKFHDGSGFLTHHLALTNSFEAAIRSVDPSVTIPYWDFTIEGQAIENAGQKPSYMMEITPVFSDEWFGSVDENFHIADSRWAHAQIPLQTDKYSSVQNSFGLIRSYWNNNPELEVERILFNTCGVEPTQKLIPACTHHYDVLNSYNLGAFQQIAPGDGHGPMHVQLGGMRGGCNEAYAAFQEKWGSVLSEDVDEDTLNALGYTVYQTKEEMEASGYTKWKWGTTAPRQLMIDKAIMGEYFHIYRSLWRSHMCAEDGRFQYLVCPETCDNSMTYEDCSCQVEALVTGRTTWQNLFPCVLNSDENQRDFLAAMPEELLSDIVTMVSTSSVIEGDMVESSSPADPLFWMIHPVIERLLVAKRLPDVTTMGSKPFYKWEDMGGASEHWVSYSFYDLGLNEVPSHRQPYTCEGHAATDPVLPEPVTALTDALEKYADFDGDGVITNYELYTALDPNVLEYNDYVFDNFKWDHCD